MAPAFLIPELHRPVAEGGHGMTLAEAGLVASAPMVGTMVALDRESGAVVRTLDIGNAIDAIGLDNPEHQTVHRGHGRIGIVAAHVADSLVHRHALQHRGHFFQRGGSAQALLAQPIAGGHHGPAVTGPSHGLATAPVPVQGRANCMAMKTTTPRMGLSYENKSVPTIPTMTMICWRAAAVKASSSEPGRVSDRLVKARGGRH